MKAGDRIRMMDIPEDPNPLAKGEMGTVQIIAKFEFPDGSWSQVGVKLDNGRTLMLCIPPDVVEVLA